MHYAWLQGEIGCLQSARSFDYHASYHKWCIRNISVSIVGVSQNFLALALPAVAASRPLSHGKRSLGAPWGSGWTGAPGLSSGTASPISFCAAAWLQWRWSAPGAHGGAGDSPLWFAGCASWDTLTLPVWCISSYIMFPKHYWGYVVGVGIWLEVQMFGKLIRYSHLCIVSILHMWTISHPIMRLSMWIMQCELLTVCMSLHHTHSWALSH